MKRRWFLLPPLLLLLTGCLMSAGVALLRVSPVNDVVAMRRIASEAALHWEDLQNAGWEDFPLPFCILSLNGAVLYRTGGDAVEDSSAALAQGSPILDVEKDGRIVGRVIITSNQDGKLSWYRKATAAILLLFSLTAALLSWLYYIYLHRKIVSPFRDLKQFASQVAGGNLDFPLKREKNNLFGAFTESFDMLREQLKLAKEREYEANRRQKELVASLSHDIKTPVTSIRLTSELLLELEPDERLRTKLRMIFEKTEQIEALVNNLFQTTLQDIEQFPVIPTDVYSSSLVEMIKNADYAGKAQLSSIPECMLYLDELRFSQVLSNIISNSYKYAGTKINVEAELTGSYLKLCIRDYGPGVPEEEAPLLFNRFYRGSNASPGNGSGLGLYICKKIMEQMQGEIYCACSMESFAIIVLLKLA